MGVVECHLCEVSPFWEHFWVILGPGLTLIGSLLLVWVAWKGLKAQGHSLSEVVLSRLRRLFRRKQGDDIVKVVTGAVEIEEGADVAAGRGYVASPQVKTMIAAVARLMEHERTDAFGDAVTAAADELAAEVESLDEKLSLAELRMSGLETRLDSADAVAKELRAVLFELADLAGKDKVEILGRLQEVEVRGFWQTFWAAILIPLGIFLTIVVGVCNLACF
jgi:hypothetical protein